MPASLFSPLPFSLGLGALSSKRSPALASSGDVLLDGVFTVLRELRSLEAQAADADQSALRAALRSSAAPLASFVLSSYRCRDSSLPLQQACSWSPARRRLVASLLREQAEEAAKQTEGLRTIRGALAGRLALLLSSLKTAVAGHQALGAVGAPLPPSIASLHAQCTAIQSDLRVVDAQLAAMQRKAAEEEIERHCDSSSAAATPSHPLHNSSVHSAASSSSSSASSRFSTPAESVSQSPSSPSSAASTRSAAADGGARMGALLFSPILAEAPEAPSRHSTPAATAVAAHSIDRAATGEPDKTDGNGEDEYSDIDDAPLPPPLFASAVDSSPLPALVKAEQEVSSAELHEMNHVANVSHSTPSALDLLFEKIYSSSPSFSQAPIPAADQCEPVVVGGDLAEVDHASAELDLECELDRSSSPTGSQCAFHTPGPSASSWKIVVSSPSPPRQTPAATTVSPAVERTPLRELAVTPVAEALPTRIEFDQQQEQEDDCASPQANASMASDPLTGMTEYTPFASRSPSKHFAHLLLSSPAPLSATVVVAAPLTPATPIARVTIPCVSVVPASRDSPQRSSELSLLLRTQEGRDRRRTWMGVMAARNADQSLLYDDDSDSEDSLAQSVSHRSPATVTSSASTPSKRPRPSIASLLQRSGTKSLASLVADTPPNSEANHNAAAAVSPAPLVVEPSNPAPTPSPAWSGSVVDLSRNRALEAMVANLASFAQSPPLGDATADDESPFTSPFKPSTTELLRRVAAMNARPAANAAEEKQQPPQQSTVPLQPAKREWFEVADDLRTGDDSGEAPEAALARIASILQQAIGPLTPAAESTNDNRPSVPSSPLRYSLFKPSDAAAVIQPNRAPPQVIAAPTSFDAARLTKQQLAKNVLASQYAPSKPFPSGSARAPLKPRTNSAVVHSPTVKRQAAALVAAPTRAALKLRASEAAAPIRALSVSVKKRVGTSRGQAAAVRARNPELALQGSA